MKTNRMLKPTIISIAMATVMAGAAISPALGLIAQHFSDANPVLIKLILTAPSLTVIPFSFISSYLTRKIPKRSIVLIGISIYVIAGVGAQFAENIWLLLGLRFVLGAGVGLVMPLSFTLISDHFKGEERAQMMGYNTAFSNIGGIVTMLLAGFLASFSWKMPFNVYLLGVIIFILVYFYLPKNEPLTPSTGKQKEKIPPSVYGYAFASLGIMLAYIAIATNMALFLEQDNLGGSKIAGFVISFSTVGGLMTSVTLVRLRSVFKDHLLAVSLAVMGAGFGIISLSYSIPLILLGVLFVGFGQGVLFPLINVKVLGNVSPTISDKVISIVSSMIYVGQFISPVVLQFIGDLFARPTIRFEYTVLAISLIASVLIMALYKQIANRGAQER